ncbi:helix-turn-helix domain-containing protein [Micromonospora sp. DT233]|uniref:helix-turn-helix domain-containing protein n=1 Tax=Micromonospora sp. DT233 TaxID=3393432 RepID=UPI003CF49D80
MTGPRRRKAGKHAPIGRRIAELRTGRGMSQQVFADRVGKSKSWVDKIERGVRVLDRLSVINTVAAALGVTPAILLGGTNPPAPATDTRADIEQIRAALARHAAPASPEHPPLTQLDAQAGYAWAAYRNGNHPQVLRALPDLLDQTRYARHHAPPGSQPAADLLVRVYRLTAQLMVKLGEPHLAWLAADRAMTAATGDPHRTGLAAISLAQALRALRRSRLAVTAAHTAVHQLDLTPARVFLPDEPALTGTLLLEAALAAATSGDAPTADDLTDRATQLAYSSAAGQRNDHDGYAFGPTAVDLTRALTATRLGDHQRAVTIHRQATSDDGWHRLPAEHRAAHLIDISRAHLDLGDPHAAGRALITADAIAPAELRTRPTAHAALAAVIRSGTAAADVTRLAATIGLTRR